MKKAVSTSLCLCVLLTSLAGCGQAQSGEVRSGGVTTSESGGLVSEPAIAAVDTAVTDAEMFTDRDGRTEYDPDTAVKIELNGSSAQASGGGVRISGSTITVTEEGVYLISGTLEDGMLMVDAPDTAKLQLVFDCAAITSSASAPLYIKEADKVFVTLVGENSLSNGGGFANVDENNIDGAVFSKQDLTFNGAGSLTVTSPAGHGIVCKDNLVFTGGSFDIAAASHAIDANDSVRIKDASITAQAGKDGIHAENSDDSEKGFVYIASGSLQIESEGDGISAGAYLYAADGTVEILAGGGYENGTKQASEAWGTFGRGGGGARQDKTADGTMGAAPPEQPTGEMPKGGRPGGEMTTGEMPEGGRSGEMPTGEMPEGGRSGGMPGREMPGGGGPGDAATDTTPDTPQTSGTDTAGAVGEDSSTSMKGLKANGTLFIEGGTFTIDAADDGIHSNTSVTIRGGMFEIASGDDGVHAEDNLTVTAGTIHITHSYEGLEALHLSLEGGEIDLTATDDGLNAAGGTDQSGLGKRDGMFGGPMQGSSDGSIVISGGTISINASGDGIDANGTLEIIGGYTMVTGPTQGDTSTLDYDVSGTISGGTFIGTGASSMAQTFTGSAQGVVSVNTGRQSAGTQIILTDAAGNVILTHAPALEYEIVILSAPAVKPEESYTLTVGDTVQSVTAK